MCRKCKFKTFELYIFLFAAKQLTYIHRDAEEVISWMKEKEMVMHSDEFGSDVASVQKLQRDHESVAYDMTALKDKVVLVRLWK